MGSHDVVASLYCAAFQAGAPEAGFKPSAFGLNFIEFPTSSSAPGRSWPPV